MTIDKLPLTISELHQNLKQKNYTCVDLVDAYLSRINEYDKQINSFITVTDNYAYQQAKKWSKVIADNPNAFAEYPLLGVVVSLKDIYMTQGIRTTAGSKVLENYTAQYSATAVERLEKAGAVVIGKANLDAWAHGSSGENSDFGPTKNPWNTEYIPGGSSSGSAASVAAQFCLLSLGTDTGGSVRNPASRTNLTALKPTYGVIPRYGVVAMASSLDTVGEFARTVEDVETLFNTLKGPDGKDATIADFEEHAVVPKDTYTLGMPAEYFDNSLNSEVKKIVESVIAEYEKLGIKVEKISLPSTKYAISAYYIIQPAEVSSNLSRYTGVRYGNSREAFGAEANRRIMLGSYVLSSGYYDAYYLRAMKVRTVLRQEFDNVFDQVDALIAPVAPTPPTKIGEMVDDPLQMYLEDVLSVTANLAGIPSLALPGGFTSRGLPVGFQLMGPRFSENVLFDLGRKYQRVTDWHLKTPVL